MLGGGNRDRGGCVDRRGGAGGGEGPGKKVDSEPDSKISLFKPHLGNPAYAVVGTDGRVEPIEVEVTTYNQGR